MQAQSWTDELGGRANSRWLGLSSQTPMQSLENLDSLLPRDPEARRGGPGRQEPCDRRNVVFFTEIDSGIRRNHR